jgi:eukaryotic-like serine/threonine-protein kinase
VARVDAETTFEKTAAALDTYAQEWTAARVEACEATRVRNEQSEDMLEMRYACLDNRLYRVESLLEVLSQPTQENVFGSLSLVQHLPAVAECTELARLRALAPIPNDPETAVVVQAMRRRIAHAEALGTSGRISDAAEELRILVEEARAIGFPPLLADTLDHQARVAMYAGDADEAEQAFEEAQLIAEAHGYDGLLVRTHAELAVLYTTRKTELVLAHRHLRRAAAVLERMGNSPRLRMELDLSEARVFMTERNNPQALAAFERYLAAAREQGRDNEAGAIAALSSYGHLLNETGRDEEAAEALADALERARSVLGPAHPEVGGVLIHRARLLAGQGKKTEALAEFEEARLLYGAAFGEAHANLGAVLNDEGIVLSQLGRHEEALKKYEAAEPIIAARYGEANLQYTQVLMNIGHQQVLLGRAAEGVVALERAAESRKRLAGAKAEPYAYALGYLGEAQLELGQTAKAGEAFAESLAVYTAVYGEDSEWLAQSEIGLGDVAMLEGRSEDARAHYERAALLNGDEWYAWEGRARFGLARVELSAGDRELSVARAREARDLIARDPAAARDLAKIDSWLAEITRSSPGEPSPPK